jgi:hypothetical protein
LFEAKASLHRNPFSERENFGRSQNRHEVEGICGCVGNGGSHDRLVAIVRHSHDEESAVLRQVGSNSAGAE